ncbi:cell division regulator GpsB [Virgibacillus soli]|uniref:Cell division regulator GpsB n=1 Tax=Paracerasibacillus soli TaxID=480284 RepID=A0ABU5CPK5_9BACI|nr:cell division regulator GpsB [Virgibacillus soli]MDY0408285.1 cell division regulator GpsB [Virgibacillus soli]
MAESKKQLNAKDILEKDFKVSMRGYNQEEVDKFLDVIIQDYEAFQQKIQTLTEENERLKQQQTEQPRTRSATPNHQVNYDVLKRLSNLEKAVFGAKYANANTES